MCLMTLVITVIPCDLSLIRILMSDIKILIMNTLPIQGGMLLIYSISNHIGVSFLLTGIICFAISEVNRFKMVFRDDPFVFSDVLLVNEAKDMMGKYELYLDKVSLCAIIFLIAGTFFCFYFLKVKLDNKKIRLAYGGIFLVVMIMLGKVLYFEDEDIYNNTWHYQFGNMWKNGNQCMSRGIIYSFVRSIPDAITIPPEGYAEEEVIEILEEYETTPLDEDKQAHVISIMLEAYNDFSEFEGVEFVRDPYEAFHELQSESYHGKLFTNIFAAGTVQTERAFLTGYRDPVIKDRNVESYVRYFNEQGYYTEAMHPCYGWFYNRKNVNEYLGFDNFLYYENKFENVDENELEVETYHGLLSDYDFFDYIIQGHEDALKNNHKYFNFSVTYQNHGPYADEKETDETYLLKKEGYTDAEYNIINNYLYHISKTDRAIEKLRTYIDQQEEPIVLILFGDHNPWLGDNNSVYEMLDIDLNLDTTVGAENYYQTPYLVYANTSAKKMYGKSFSEQENTISPMFLMNEVFEYIGIEGSAYLNYLQDIKEEYSIINTVYTGESDDLFLTCELTDDKTLIEQERVEYYMKNVKSVD